MALKAGYNGIKKSVLDKLLQMSGALIIKSLGTALSLSDAGELRVRNASDSHSGVVQPDGETTSIVDGKLVALSAGGISFIDETNIIASQDNIGVGSFSYTAEEDCYIAAYIIPTSNNTFLNINNVVIGAYYNPSNVTVAQLVILPIKSGDTVSFTGLNTQYGSSYKVFGLK